jgi:hypothetical protein
LVGWAVEIGDEFEPEFLKLPQDVRTKFLPTPGSCSNSGRNWGVRASIR